MTETFTPKEYAEHLAEAGKVLNRQAVATISRAAGNIKRDWRDRAAVSNKRAAKKYPSTIVQRRTKLEAGYITATVETVSRGQGKLGAILEHGGPRNAPQLNNRKAAAVEAPNLAEWLARLAADSCR